MPQLQDRDRPTKRLVITSTFAADPITQHITWWSKQMLPFELSITLNANRLLQDLFYPRSEFMNQFDYRVVFNRFEDWIRNDDQLEPYKYEKLEFVLSEMLNAVEKASQREALMVAVFPISTEAGLSHTLYQYLQDVNQRWNAALQLIPGIHIIDFEKAQKQYGVEKPFDYVKETLAHMPFTHTFDAVMGSYLVRQLHALSNQKFKAIILDCDNTLWEGICGENKANVVIDEPYRALQQFMLEKMEEGMVLGIVSKNNEADVWNVFENHKDMVLKKEHFVSWRINWINKAENIREIAKELNIGLDSMLFIDDSPYECLEVMNQLPEVFTLKLPEGKKHIPSFLSHIWAVDKAMITDEDRQRTALYQIDKKRKSSVAKSPEQYLQDLELKVYMDLAANEMLPRLAQLTQRTNQFNSSIIRRTERELEHLLTQENYACWAIEVTDRYGTYGLTGLLITEASESKLRIDTFLLSCRVLGRGIEAAILSLLKKFCEEKGISQVELVLNKGPKNMAIQNYLEDSGWIEDTTGSDHTLFCISTAQISDGVPYIESMFCKGLLGNYSAPKDHSIAPKMEIQISSGWETFIENQVELVHRNQYVPLEYGDLNKLTYLPLSSIKDPTNLKDKPLSEIEKAVAAAVCTVWGRDDVSMSDKMVVSEEPSWILYAFLSEIYKKFDLILPIESLENTIALTQIVAYLEKELRGKDDVYV